MKSTVLIAAVLMVGWSTANAADIEAGRKISEAQCAACHGKDGQTPIDPAYPKLAGQHADYLIKALQDYRNGGRKNAIMAGQVSALKRADLQNIAAYFASLPGPLTQAK